MQDFEAEFDRPSFKNPGSAGVDHLKRDPKQEIICAFLTPDGLTHQLQRLALSFKASPKGTRKAETLSCNKIYIKKKIVRF